MSRVLQKKDGFSFIEVLFALVLISVLVAFFGESFSNTANEFSNLSDRLVANQILQERVSNLKSVSGLFPAVVDDQGRKGFFVACSDRHGVPTRDAAGDPVEALAFDVTPGTPSGKCVGSEVEAQFKPAENGEPKIEMSVLLFSKSGKLVSTHQQVVKLERNF